MGLFATTEEGAGQWALIVTLASLLLTFLVTQRRDRRKAENDAVLQWKELAAAAISARDAAYAELKTAFAEILALRVRVRELEIQSQTVAPKETKS